jgi:hypothetical protein
MPDAPPTSSDAPAAAAGRRPPPRGRNPIAPLEPPPDGVYPAEQVPADRGEALVWRTLGARRPPGWTLWHHIVVGRSFHQAEIDFAVAIPGRGVVLIEVKAGRMSRKDGRWLQNGRALDRQPGDQVERARRSLLHELGRRFPGVPFPEITVALCFPETPGAEWRPIGGPPVLFQEDVQWFEAGGQDRLLSAFSAQRPYPDDPRFLGALHALWGPDWWPVPALTRAPERAEVAWRQLTPEQLAVLTCLGDSARLLIEGPPGSGKTVLLMALAERLQSAGQRALVVSFTKAIAAELRRAGLLSVYPIREYALSRARRWGLIGRDEDVETWPSEVWTEMLRAVCGHLRGHPAAEPWDIVLVDEYQDLGPLDWELLDGLVGERTRLWLFGDDQQRALSHARGAAIPARLAPGGIFRLHGGLRSPPALLELAAGLLQGERAAAAGASALDGCLERVLLPDGADDAGRLAAICEAVDRALADPQIGPADIAVLSFGSAVSSRLRGWDRLGRALVMRADEEPAPGAVLADTVLRAKGLERPVVVLTDLDLASSGALRRLLYVGLTRASWRCVVVGTAAELAPLG